MSVEQLQRIDDNYLIMKLVTSVLFAVLVLFAIYSEINAQSPDDSTNCQGVFDLRCPQLGCGPNGVKGGTPQDNSKPWPGCCATIMCN